ncbi:hypothetical protein [Pedobacter sp. B4-66]|uniref:hypothetical protein n=1 Tax=Pedobacter sp. B4-66 TaxID=2817280 RepID=UPI001BDAF8A1|nr:hypothetical protein [Pedobacter sp. B4-66]
MKKILVIVIALFTAIITLAYMYFSGLNTQRENNDSSLYAATVNSGVIFSFQNDKSIFDILKGQNILQEVIGERNYSQLQSIKDYILSAPDLNRIIGKQNIYISLIPGKDKQIDLLYSTQINSEASKNQLINALASAKLQLDSSQKITTITLPDSAVFYLAIKGNLLLLSSAIKPVSNVLSASINDNNKFVQYIKSTSRLTKNSLAEIYINFKDLPLLLKATMPGKLNGELSVLDNRNTFASLIYNFSKEKVLLTGSTQDNELNDYYQLFSTSNAQKTTATNILPENTANYTVFAIENYATWKKNLDAWFTEKKELNATSNILKNITLNYHIDPNQIFPKYFKDQLITFQLNTAEKIGAINLSNGEKVEQLLLDLSSDYGDGIKIFKESDLLYSYFGEPFKKFKRPYYIIIDNYMIFANNVSTLQSFLNSYKNNRLLINKESYVSSVNQLPNTSNITFFIDLDNSSEIFLKNIYLPYYKHITTEKGLRNYQSFTYQLSGDNGKFQTNVLMNRKQQPLNQDSLKLENDSL